MEDLIPHEEGSWDLVEACHHEEFLQAGEVEVGLIIILLLNIADDDLPRTTLMLRTADMTTKTSGWPAKCPQWI